MSHASPAEIQKQVKIYVAVFATLAILTFVTVGISYLHLTPVFAVLIALLIASIKGGLVAAYFMHLISEKKLILFVLFMTVITFAILIFLVILSDKGMFTIPHVT